MNLPREIFRAYDIRGLVGKTLTAEIVRAVGRALGTLGIERGAPTFAIGRDGRLSGPELFPALAEGILESGANVIDLGMVPTPVAYFAAHHLGCQSAAVLTGSHPEYVSGNMLDALTAFNRQGGHLAYLGGNGFYCAVTVYPDAPHVMELRRGHASGMHWKSPLGETYHAATGEPGGYWRLRGRSSHRLFGIGTSSVLFDRGQPFMRTEESRRPDEAYALSTRRSIREWAGAASKPSIRTPRLGAVRSSTVSRL